jgi:hypothetical protein
MSSISVEEEEEEAVKRRRERWIRKEVAIGLL